MRQMLRYISIMLRLLTHFCIRPMWSEGVARAGHLVRIEMN